LDGTRVTTGVAQLAQPAAPFGVFDIANFQPKFNGYIDELRYTRACRSTGASYTVDTAAFPDE
jgi:hypothetical protein